MSDYNWCHNPNCHTIATVSRVRGSRDNKVLRTVKIPLSSHYIRNSIMLISVIKIAYINS